MHNAFSDVFPIGLGTARFPFISPESYIDDFNNAVDLVLYALDNGVNYIDVGKGYSTNHAFAVLKEAFKRTDKPFNVTVKINAYDKAYSANDYYKEACSVLDSLGLEKASHFLLWTLTNSEQLNRATGDDNLYSAALRLKAEGKIKYIGTSVHMLYDDIITVINSGLFEFVQVSYHLLNYPEMQRVLDIALEKDVDILVMNPLYGGLIPDNEQLFNYAKLNENETVVQAAVRALLCHPAVKCILAGASNKNQLDEYLSAISPDFDEQNKVRRKEMLKNYVQNNSSFCSYCKYCIDCPKKIPVPQIMNSRNVLLLQGGEINDSIKRVYFKSLNEKYNIEFKTWQNPCIRCGKCERRCTQHLNIIESVAETYRMVKECSYDMESRKERFDNLINKYRYTKVGFWPASAGTMKILDIYKKIFGDIPFEVYLFDSNSDFHGISRFGHIVYSKNDAQSLGIDCILITSYLHGETIYDNIKDLTDSGIDVKTLYKKGDVDWWW